MTNKDNTAYESYPKDRYDNPEPGPVGVHRGNTSLASRMIPYVISIIVALLAGVLIWGIYSGEFNKIRFPWQSSSTDNSQVQNSSAPSNQKKKTKGPAKKKEKQPTDDANNQSTNGQTNGTQPETASTVNKATAVSLVNGTGISGHAAQKAGLLRNAGYSNVTAMNPNSQLPTSTVVWYQNDTDKATADDVAKTLGISSVEKTSGITSPIMVVLLN